jgi:CheY-like chemotaxis protein
MADRTPTPSSTKRAVPVVEIGYRSAGAFLVAYVSQIARGELYIESPTLPPRGTPLALRIAAPPATMTLEGMVVGTREARPGQPAGISVALTPPSDAFSATVDRLAAAFAGFRVLLSTGEAAPRAILGRYLRSIMTSTVVDYDVETDRSLDLGTFDLVVVDLDSSGPRGFELGQRVRQRPRAAPVLALAQLERDRAIASGLGFEEVLPNPPAFADLDAAVRRALSRPLTIHHATRYGTLKGYGAD